MSGSEIRRFGRVVMGAVLVLATAGLFMWTRPGAADGPLPEDHFVPADKKLDPAWVRGLYDKGGPRICTGDELKYIGMPVGGLGAGQLYLGGDGRLLHWAIFNKHVNTGYGSKCYRPWAPPGAVDQGFAVRVLRGGKAEARRLDATGFADVRFLGEYPIGRVEYRDTRLGVEVTLEAFSPFIPLSAGDSGLPATILRFVVRNTGRSAAEVTIAGWLANAVLHDSRQTATGRWVNRPWSTDAARGAAFAFEPLPPPPGVGKPEVFADFEGDDYGAWKAEGEAFGKGPARGTLPRQQAVSGFRGKGLVNTFLGQDGPRGKLTSPAFTIARPFINFLVGGGNQAGKTCINLIVDGKVVRTAAGRQEERLTWQAWPVKEWIGKEARIEIVDDASGPWGHVNVDQIEFADAPAGEPADVKDRADFGTMALAVLGPAEGAAVAAALPDGDLPDGLFAADGSLAAEEASGEGPRRAAAARTLRLGPDEAGVAGFAVAWHFPNHRQGRAYAKRFADAGAVAQYVGKELERLAGDTRLWHDTYYDSTLPHWLLDRLHMPVSILATNTVEWWGNGRLYAWEGVGCCAGTCTHVWNYEQAMARLQPELERSARTMQDFGEGFDGETGLVGFRSNRAYAADGQCGTILKAYREHLMSPDDAFLQANYAKVRKAAEFLLGQDGADGAVDGLITNSQHNTYDINFEGPNTFVGALYLAALRAMEEMARRAGDGDFAARCRQAFQSGQTATMDQLFNGEYFIQKVDLAKHPKHQYADGCLADQLFGQNWAHQLHLGYLYPQEAVRKAMQAVYKYNWAPDVAPQNQAHPPERIFASPGEAGLFICTWPRSRHLGKDSVRYRDEVWTGIEYQVAAGLIYEGLLDEAMTVIRAVHDRYDPAKRNPWNEVECGDHYARAMASWGCLLALSGFEYDGPAGRLAFAPRITPADFRCAFTAAEGWGTLAQKRSARQQSNAIHVTWGGLTLREVGLAIPDSWPQASIRVTVGGDGAPADAKTSVEAGRLTVRFARPWVLRAGQRLDVTAERQ